MAVISGRPIAQIDNFLQPLQLAIAGEHGAEVRDAQGRMERRSGSPPEGLVSAAKRLASAHTGLLFEAKSNGFAFHFRARPELEAECRTALERAMSALPEATNDWEWLNGHLVIELKRKSVSKGVAVRQFLLQPPFAGRLPVFIGDDVTDEAGIVEVQAAGGFGVRVGDGASQAHYRLAGPSAVGDWLTASLKAELT